jgi:hypothetical protein
LGGGEAAACAAQGLRFIPRFHDLSHWKLNRSVEYIGLEVNGNMKQLCLILGLSGFLMTGCGGTPPQNPSATAVAWKVYSNPVVGYTLEHPDLYETEEDLDGGTVLLRYDGYPVISIRHADEQEGRRHGLWIKHEAVGSIELDRREGLKYIYDHYDGPFYMRTVSYVVEYGGKFLGLEFRTDREELDDVQRRVLRSFRFIGED